MPCAKPPSSSRSPLGFRDGSGGWRIKPSPHASRRSAADDDRPEVRREVHLPAVLRANRRRLYRGRLERRRTATPRLVSQHPRQSGRRRAGRDRKDKGAGPDRYRRGARAAVGKGVGVLAALRRLPAQDRAGDPRGRARPRPLTSAAPSKLRSNAIRDPHRNARGHATPSLLKKLADKTTAAAWWSPYAAPNHDRPDDRHRFRPILPLTPTGAMHGIEIRPGDSHLSEPL